MVSLLVVADVDLDAVEDLLVVLWNDAVGDLVVQVEQDVMVQVEEDVQDVGEARYEIMEDPLVEDVDADVVTLAV